MSLSKLRIEPMSSMENMLLAVRARRLSRLQTALFAIMMSIRERCPGGFEFAYAIAATNTTRRRVAEFRPSSYTAVRCISAPHLSRAGLPLACV